MNWNRLVLLFSGVVLLTAALERFLLASDHTPLLSLPDPALGLPLRYTILAVGALELLVALICLFGKNPRLQLAWLAWLSTDYLAFRICLLWIGVHPQNTCIGALTDPLHLSRSSIGLLLPLLPIGLLLYTYSALLCRSPAKAGHTLAAPQFNEGGSHSALHSPQSAFLKASCSVCQGHIEFPAHGLGQTIPCPHCRTPLTLKAPV